MTEKANAAADDRSPGSEGASSSAADFYLSTFSGLGYRLSAAQTAREAGEIICDVADQLLGWDACFLDLYSPREDVLIHVLNRDTVDGRRFESEPKCDRRSPSPLARKAIQEGGQLVLKDDPTQMRPEGRPFGNVARPSASLLFVPVRNGAEVTGVLSIQSYTPQAYTQHSLGILQALADHCGGALARIRITEAMYRRAESEALVSTLSTSFVNVAPEEFDAVVNRALKLLGGFLRADHCCLFQCVPGSRGSQSTYQWPAGQVALCAGSCQGALGAEPSWWFQELQRSDVICVPEVSALSSEASAEKQLFESQGIQSTLAVPLRYGGAFLGFVRVSTIRRRQFWTEEQVSLLKTAGRILANALEHEGQAKQLQLQAAALESAANSIVITNPEGLVSWVNPAFSRLTGYAAHEVIGKKPNVLKSGKHDADFYRALWETITAGEVWHGELINKRKDGSLYAEEMTVTPVRGENGNITHYIAIKQDVSERKRTELRNSVLSQLGQKLSAAKTIRDAAEIIVAAAEQLMGLDACTLDLYSAETDRLSHVLNWDTIDGRRVECPRVYRDEPPSARMRRALTCGPLLIFQDEARTVSPDAKPFGDAARPSASMMFVPIRDGTSVVGVISVHSYTARAYDSRSLETLQMLANHCAEALGRIRAQEALSESEANYRRVFETSPEAIFVHSQGRFVFANPAALKLLGAERPEQLLGRSVLDIVPPENHAMVLQRIQCETERETTPLLEQRIIRLDGTSLEVEATGIPFTYRGKPAAQTVMRDIAERKRGVARLSAFSTLGHRLSAAQTAKDAARIIVEVADELLGWDACSCDLYSEAEGLVRPVLNMDLIDGRRTECPSAYSQTPPPPLLKRAISEGAILILRQEGEPAGAGLMPFGDTARKSASLMFAPIRNGGGVVGVLSIQSYMPNAYDQLSLETLQALAGHCVGALERIRSQEELRWKTAFLEAQMNSSLDGILLVDNHGCKFLQNQRTTELWNIPPEIAADSDDARQIQFITRMLKNPEEFTAKVRHLYSHPGEVSRDELELVNGMVLDRYSAPVVGRDGTHYGRIWTFRDITNSRRLEAQLRQSQKMQAIGLLAGGVAHDFNNLLAVIRGNTELLLLRDKHLSDESAEFLKQVIAAAERAASLTRQLLAFGRKQIMQPQPLSLTDVVGNLSKMLKRIIGEDIDLQLQYAGHLPLVEADASMIEQVLVNLVVNARDAMPKGGKLLISAEAVRFERASPQDHPEAQSGEFACLTVRDTGTGIAPEHLPHIFEPFYTTKDVGKGSGLGLATVYGIIQQHQGWVEVSSEPGLGSTFRVYLPATSTPVTAAATEHEAKLRGGSETILLVEDDHAVRQLTRRLLESAGYRVVEAASGREALGLANDAFRGAGLLLTDVVMPDGVSGRDLAERLRQKRPELKVIFMSGYSGDTLGKDTAFLQRTGSRFLSKPCSARELLRAVREVLDQKS